MLLYKGIFKKKSLKIAINDFSYFIYLKPIHNTVITYENDNRENYKLYNL